MRKQNEAGAIILKGIKYADIHSMNKNKTIVVSRVILNSRLVECELKAPTNYEEASSIIRKAIVKMSNQEDEEKQTLWGVRMKVSDVVKVFGEFNPIKDARKTFFALEEKI